LRLARGAGFRGATLAAEISGIVLLVLMSVPVASAVNPPSISAAPSTFTSGATVTVSGSYFPTGTVKVWLDLNGNGKLDGAEPYTTASPSSGSFSADLAVGEISVGSYVIDAGSGTSSEASTSVSVVDSSTLGAITAAVANLESYIDTSVSTQLTAGFSSLSTQLSSMQTSLGSAIFSLQSDIDYKLGTFNGGDSAASLLYSIQSQVSTSKGPTVTSTTGTCVAPLDTGGHTTLTHCAITNLPNDSAITLTMMIQGVSLEAGGSVFVAWGHNGCNEYSCEYFMQNTYSCDVGTCDEQSQTLILAGSTVVLTVGCDPGLTNSCSDPITVQYTLVAVGPPS
jgi:hypothetical protein